MSRTFVSQVWSENSPGNISEPNTGTQEDGYLQVIPPSQEHNWLFNLMTSMLKNAEELGIMEFNTNTIYKLGGFCTASDNLLYKSRVGNNQGVDPAGEANPTEWELVVFTSLAQLANLVADGDYYTAAGADTIVLSALPGNNSPDTFTKGKRFRFVAVGTNSTAVTITTPNITAKPLTKNGTALIAGDLENGKAYEIWVNNAETEYDLQGVVKDASEVAKGIAKLATQAIAEGKINDTDMMTSLKTQQQILASFTGSIVAEGYRIDPDGLITQWGLISHPSTGTVTESFPIVFPNNTFSISLGNLGIGTLETIQHIVSGSISTASFDHYSAAGVNAYYIAKGN